jgi:hypothetical protein
MYGQAGAEDIKEEVDKQTEEAVEGEIVDDSSTGSEQGEKKEDSK